VPNNHLHQEPKNSPGHLRMKTNFKKKNKIFFAVEPEKTSQIRILF